MFPTLAWPLWLTGPFALIADLVVDFLDIIGIKTGLYTVNKTYIKRYGPATAHFIDIGVDVLWMAVLSLAVAVIGFAWQPLVRPAINNISNLLNPAPQAVNLPAVIVVPSQTQTLEATPSPTETMLPTHTPTLTPTPTAIALSYSFGSSVKPETLQAIMENLSMQPEDFVYNFTDGSYPAVAAYGEVVSYELSDKGLYLLFATTGGILKARIDYFLVVSSPSLVPEHLAISELTYDQALQVRDHLDKGINELNKDPRDPFGHQGTWIVIEAITSKADAEKCKNDLASLDNWEELCFYNRPLSTITPQELEEIIRGAIVPTDTLDVNSPLPLLSFEKDVSARIVVEVP